MPLNITFETIEDIKEFRNSVQILKLQILQFQAIVVRDITEEITMFVIHAKMRAAGFSEKIQNSAPEIRAARVSPVDGTTAVPQR